MAEEKLVVLLALADRVEGEGYPNIGKLLRAAVESALIRAAYAQRLPEGTAGLADRVSEAIQIVESLDAEMAGDLAAALRRGLAAMKANRSITFGDTPDPFVCRTCGHVLMGKPADPCPVCGAWPGTFKAFQATYWFKELEPMDALAQLRRTPQEVALLIRGLPEQALNRQPESGGWSIKQALTHLRDAEGLLHARVNLMLEQDNPSLSAVAIQHWASKEGGQASGVLEIFDAYRDSRARTVQRLESIPLEDWGRGGYHEEFGPMTIRQQASYFAVHELTHLHQIAVMRG